MKVRGLVCVLTLSLCWPMLMSAQQSGTVELASASARNPASSVAIVEPVQSRRRSDPTPVNLRQVSPDLLRGRTLYQQIYPPSSQTACMRLPKLTVAQLNAFDQLNFHPAAIRSAFTHQNVVKMAQNFKPGSQLPDAPSYTPLSKREKFDRFLHSTHSVDTWVGAAFDSLYAQATGAYPEFGGGMGGYAHRYAAALAGAEAGNFFGKYLYPTLLHQDPRYFPSHQNDISDRLAYAASRVLITRSDDGRNVLNSSLILSQLTQAALSNAYIPYRNETVSGTLENAAAGLGSVAEAYILKEFWPDISQFLSRHQPGAVRRFRQSWEDPTPAPKSKNVFTKLRATVKPQSQP